MLKVFISRGESKTKHSSYPIAFQESLQRKMNIRPIPRSKSLAQQGRNSQDDVTRFALCRVGNNVPIIILTLHLLPLV